MYLLFNETEGWYFNPEVDASGLVREKAKAKPYTLAEASALLDALNLYKTAFPWAPWRIVANEETSFRSILPIICTICGGQDFQCPGHTQDERKAHYRKVMDRTAPK